MAKSTRSVVFALKEETTEGTLVQPGAATDFSTLRQGYTFQSGVATIATDELLGDIGMSEGFVGKQSPQGTVTKYFKHSGTEGTAPDYGELIKASVGSVATAGTEYNTSTGSTAGTAAAAGVLNMASGAGAHFVKGQALLIKDATNNYSIRNVKSISTDALTLNVNLANAPATGLGTGKAIHYVNVATGHPSYSAHLYQAATGSGFHQAMSGCRTTNMAMSFPANELASIAFNFEGLRFFQNPQVVTAGSNDAIDFNLDGSTEQTAYLTAQTVSSPVDLAADAAAKLSAVAGTAITCTYSNSTGKFTFAKASGTFQLTWAGGSHTATSAKTLFGFTADSTAALSYTSATALSYNSPYTPSYDASSATVVRYNELTIGGFARNDLRKASKVDFVVSTPRTEVKDVTAQTGISESLILHREVTMTTTLILQQNEVQEFDAMLNNSAISVMFNHGPKVAGNWVPGKCVNLYMPNAKITKNVVSDDNGIQVVQVEAKAYVIAGSETDFHINFV